MSGKKTAIITGASAVSAQRWSVAWTGLISGSITYNPEPLERPGPANVLVCCSEPNADVILESLREDL